MNIFFRLSRLPIVASNPIIAGALWVGATALTITRQTGADIPQNVQQYDILSIINTIIRKSLHSNADNGNLVNWALDNSVRTFTLIWHGLTRRSADNAITANAIPNIMAGHINGSHLVNGLNSRIFVIAFSPNILNALGFIFMIFKSTLWCLLFIYVIKTVSRQGRILFARITNDESFIDVKAEPISDKRKEYLLKNKRQN